CPAPPAKTDTVRMPKANSRLWLVVKFALGLGILVAVSRQLGRDLASESLQDINLRPPWLALVVFVYFVGMVFSGVSWYRLLTFFGQKPAILGTLRAYYLSQLGKYLPGKAWALMMRGTLAAGPDVKLSVALITTFYEVLTTM